MNLNYPLKTTFAIDLQVVFKTSIEKNYGAGFFPPVSGFLTNVTGLRNELDYSKYQKMVHADSRLCEELETKILKYLSYVLILDRKFKFESNFPKSINLPFTWTDSFNPNNKIQLSSMKLEIVSHLYNLAISEFLIGSSLIIKSEDDDKKIALKKFRVGIWAIREIKTILPSIKNIALADLTLQNLSIIESIFLGMSYFALFEIHEKNEITLGYTNIAAIIYASSKNFKLAKNIADQNKNLIPIDLAKKLNTLLYFHEAYTEGISCLKMAKNHELLIQDQVNGQHMGFAVSYAKKGNAVLESALKNSNDLALLPAIFQQKLKSVADSLKNTARILENKNNQIYKNKLFEANELPGAPEISQKLTIGPIVPEIFQKPISEESLFDVFVSEELEKELLEFKFLIEDYKNNVKNQVSAFKERKNQLFSENSINFITNFSQSQMNKKEIPEGIKAKFQEYEQRGGSIKLKQLQKNLIEKCLQCGDIVKSIKNKLENEKNEERQYKEFYKNLWNTTSSEVLNYEYYQCLNDLLGKFNQAQSVDEKILVKFHKYKENIEMFSKGPEGILQKIPSSVDNNFFQANNQKIMLLKDKADHVEKLISKNDQMFIQFTEAFLLMNLDQKLVEAKQKSAIPNQVVQIALAPINPIFMEISENIKNAQLLIDSIIIDSNALRGKMMNSSINAKALEEINFALTELTQILDDLIRGSSFYENLHAYLLSLEQTVDDYVMAREAQFSDLIQIIENSNPKNPPPHPSGGGGYQFKKESSIPKKEVNMNIEEKKLEEVEPKLFFNEESGQFPLGQSVFMPNRKMGESQVINIFESTVVSNLSDSKIKK